MKADAHECLSGKAGLVTCKVLRDWVELGGEKVYRMSKAEKAMNSGSSSTPGDCAGRSLVEDRPGSPDVGGGVGLHRGEAEERWRGCRR